MVPNLLKLKNPTSSPKKDLNNEEETLKTMKKAIIDLQGDLVADTDLEKPNSIICKYGLAFLMLLNFNKTRPQSVRKDTNTTTFLLSDGEFNSTKYVPV